MKIFCKILESKEPYYLVLHPGPKNLSCDTEPWYGPRIIFFLEQNYVWLE